jgi:PadR family transcriptional regulator, regulatory protein AphA
MPKATPSTYALLGLLAVRSWTGYELTQQATRSLHYAWPRSETHLYNEEKRLVQLGWATVREEPAGRRSRKRYTITTAGRHALREWLGTPPDAPRLEVEGLLRVFFADQGSVDEVVAALRATAVAARRDLDGLLSLTGDYLATGGPFPERLHLIALAIEQVTDLLSRIEQHSLESAAEVACWETTKGLGLTSSTRSRLEQVLARHARRDR